MVDIDEMLKDQNDMVKKLIKMRETGQICCEMCDCWSGVSLCNKGIHAKDSLEPMDDCPGFEDD